MALTSGTKLAHYEILEPLGKGGMGEVYRARDAKLGRDVAIKVLPDELANDEERLRRFQREAKVLASLNHPNIAAIYGLEHTGETHYLVLELVPGETLAERVARAPVPLDEAIEMARQIAEALEEAHEHGIVHRDLKPANVIRTDEGKIKVLDFGLAKAMVDDAAESDAATSMSPTITKDATRVGVILGTAAYMSPEQAKGRKVDKRADIFAFGAVLYEMLAGKRAFDGEDVSEVLAAVIRAEPEWSQLPPLPAGVRTLLKRCLDKDVRRRLRDIGEARLMLEGNDAGDVEEPRAQRGGSYVRAALVLAGLALGAAAASLLGERGDGSRPPVVRFDIPVPETTSGHLPSSFVVTNDDEIIFARLIGVTQQLFRRSLSNSELVAIPGTEGGSHPFLSPDGEWLGFHSGGELKKVRLDGGLASTICAVGRSQGASWGDDDRIVFTGDAGLFAVGSAGGTPTTLAQSDPEDTNLMSAPDTLPGAHAMLMAEGSGPDARIFVFSFDNGERRFLIEGAHPRYARSGHILFVRDDTLWAVPFDPRSLELDGEAVPVVEGIHTHGNYEGSQFAISRNGSLAFSSGRASEALVTPLVSVDRTGRAIELPHEPDDYMSPRFSPDGGQIAVTAGASRYDIWVLDWDRPVRTRVTFDVQGDAATWSPDGDRIAFSSSFFGVQQIFSTSTKRPGDVEVVVDSRSTNKRPSSFSPDGKTLLYTETQSTAGRDIWGVTFGEEPIPFLQTPFNERFPTFSPDGRWVAYVSDRSGRDEVYVRAYPDADSDIRVSTDGGIDPVWSPRGGELFFRSDNRMMAVPIRRDPEPAFGEPVLLFDGSYRLHLNVGMYDVTRDGERFIMLPDTTVGSTAQIHVVVNWLDALLPDDD